MRRVLFHLLDTFDHHVLRHRAYRLCCLIGSVEFGPEDKCGVGFLDRWVERREAYWAERHSIWDFIADDLTDEEYEQAYAAHVAEIDAKFGGFLVP